ncbi:MAG: hypothetical protein J6T62_12330, partial [Fibrobacter sp.]|nr:hypothetical protein [Fibrobacter sp.]
NLPYKTYPFLSHLFPLLFPLFLGSITKHSRSFPPYPIAEKEHQFQTVASPEKRSVRPPV